MEEDFRDFLSAAGQRLAAAETLLKTGYNLDARYLAGYTIECSLKALILHATPTRDPQSTLKDIKTHNFEDLTQMLVDRGRQISPALAKYFRRSPPWSPNLRYQSGRINTGQARAFLQTAREVYDWAKNVCEKSKEQLP